MIRLAFALAALLAACSGGGMAQSTSPTVDRECTNASCCGLGWHWQPFVGCQQIAPPYCGCDCSGPEPVVYPSPEECAAAHPPATTATPAPAP
jgi:hypothetical protein